MTLSQLELPRVGNDDITETSKWYTTVLFFFSFYPRELVSTLASTPEQKGAQRRLSHPLCPSPTPLPNTMDLTAPSHPASKKLCLIFEDRIYRQKSPEINRWLLDRTHQS
jgi:hypothetical protein